MAIYRCEVKPIKRSDGRSATAGAAYRAGSKIYDERTGLTHDYTRKTGVLHTEIMTPPGAPDWTQDRAKLWNAVEIREDASTRRATAQVAREALLILPYELNLEEQKKLVHDFVQKEFVDLGMIADVAIHSPNSKGDNRNFHVHVLLTTRDITKDGFIGKNRSWNENGKWNDKTMTGKINMVDKWREEWANHVNQALERAGFSERVDHRSLKDQGLDREPEPKQGPVATSIEYQGRESLAGNDRRAVKARNQKIEDLKREAEVISLEAARIKRQMAKSGRDSGVSLIDRTQALDQQKAELSQGQRHEASEMARKHGNAEAALQARLSREKKNMEVRQAEAKKRAWGAVYVRQRRELKALDAEQNTFFKRTLRGLDITGTLKRKAGKEIRQLEARHSQERKEEGKRLAQDRREAQDRIKDKQHTSRQNLQARQSLEKTTMIRQHEDQLKKIERQRESLLIRERERALQEDFNRQRDRSRGMER